MSVFLFVLGALSVLGGAAAIAFGVPVKEFSFGDTLIVAGTIGVVGGLILIGLGAAVSQLQRVAELIGARPLSRSGRPLEPFAGPSGRIPFPPKPKAEPPSEPAPARIAPAQVAAPTVTPDAAVQPPSLPNPDVHLTAEEDEGQAPLERPQKLSRPPFAPPAAKVAAEAQQPVTPPAPKPAEAEEKPALPPTFEPPWRSPPPPPRPAQPSYFDKMWPPEQRGENWPSRAESIPRAPAPSPESEPELAALEPAAPEVAEPEPPEPPRSEEVRAVAILKSGVVDGMGYTLYVDGSIEAELPDGTLRFASINELRAHLERNS